MRAVFTVQDTYSTTKTTAEKAASRFTAKPEMWESLY